MFFSRACSLCPLFGGSVQAKGRREDEGRRHQRARNMAEPRLLVRPCHIYVSRLLLLFISTVTLWAVTVAATALPFQGTHAALPLRLRGGIDQYGMNDGFRNRRPSPTAIKRIQSELAELKREPQDFFCAEPLPDDMLDWHFVLLGAENTTFEKGLFHGRIMLDQDYPMKPPRVIFLTETGRFEVGVPVCLSITSHHAECWQPLWDIRTALTAIRAFMETPAGGALGGIDSADEDLLIYAEMSRTMPSRLDFLSDCAQPTQAMRLHQRMHAHLAEVAGISTAPSRYERMRVISSEGCLVGVLRSTLLHCAVTLLSAANFLGGGVDAVRVVKEVWGEDGCSRVRDWVGNSNAQAVAALKEEVANVTAAKLRLERAVAYKDQQRLHCLGEMASAEERTDKAELELADLKGHLERLLHQLALRDQTLADMAQLEKPFCKLPPGLGGIDPREPKSAQEAERLLRELTSGKQMPEDVVKERMAEAKQWALQRLQTAEVSGRALSEDAEERARRDRRRARLEASAAAQSFQGLSFPKGGIDLDSCVPKWLEDMSGISIDK